MKSGYKKTDVGVIPEDWDVQRVGAVIDEISMGPFGSDITVSNFVKEGVPVLNGANVAGERLVDGVENYVTPEKAKSLKKAVARRGDVVVTHRGTIGQIAYIPDDSLFERYVISQSQFRVRFSRDVLPEWAVRFFHSEQGVKRLLEGKGHTGVPAIAQPTTTFRGLPLPLPGKKEQSNIAAVLYDVDVLLAAQDALIAKKRAMKKGAMQMLLAGKRRLPGFHEKWGVTRLGEVAKIRNEKIATTDVPPETLCVELENVGQGSGRLESRSTAGNAISIKYIFQAGDVLFGRLRSYLRKYWLATESGVCTTEIWPLMVEEKVVASVYLFAVVQTDEFIDTASLASGTHMPRADWGVVCNYEIPLPPIEEQIAIASALSDMEAEVAAIEAQRAKTAQLKQGMMQQLLTGRIRLI